MLHEWFSDIASFVEHPVYSIFKMYSVLFLVFWFWFATVCPKCKYKSHLFLKFVVLRKGNIFIDSLLSTLYIAFSECMVGWFYFLYFNFANKIQFLLKFHGLREKNGDIASFVEHPVYNIFKM